MPKKPLISRDDLLGGLRGGSKRRAVTALTLIEARAARDTIERGTVNSPFMTETAFRERNQAYLSAVAASADKKNRISVRDLERSADVWRALVPDNPDVRSEIAFLVGEKYGFWKELTPRMSLALGFEDSAVQAAFERSHAKPISSLFREQLSSVERVKWGWFGVSNRIDLLPPFWTAFALTITETVGAGTLALPIAFSSIGPLPGIVLLVVLGLVNLATVAYFAETSARSGSIRYGNAFVGRLIQDYLGVPASVLFRISLFAFCCIMLASYYTGFASTVSAVTGLPPGLWVVVVCAVGLILILRQSLVGTLASALVIGFLNIGILVLLSVLALNYATHENLTYAQVPFVGGQEFEASHLQLVFGIVLVSYFGHLSVSNCAQAVLRRDPDGRSLKWGTIAAMGVAIAIYCLWTTLEGSQWAVGSSALLGETGTALVPLAEKIGSEVYILGVVFAILGLGMSSVHFGLGIFNMSQELVSASVRKNSTSRFGKYATSITAVAPILCVFGYVQWTYFNGTPSFTEPLKLLGVILTPVLAGIFPVLLLLASRASGLSVGGAKLSALTSNGLVLTLVVALSFAGLLLHGFVIWQEPLSRAFAIGTAVVLLILIVDLVRRRVFKPSLNVALRYMPEQNHEARLSLAFNGEPVSTNVTIVRHDNSESTVQSDELIGQFESVREIKITLTKLWGSKLSVDARKVSNDFQTEGLEGSLVFSADESVAATHQLLSSSGLTGANIPSRSAYLRVILGTASRSR